MAFAGSPACASPIPCADGEIAADAFIAETTTRAALAAVAIQLGYGRAPIGPAPER